MIFLKPALDKMQDLIFMMLSLVCFNMKGCFIPTMWHSWFYSPNQPVLFVFCFVFLLVTHGFPVTLSNGLLLLLCLQWIKQNICDEYQRKVLFRFNPLSFAFSMGQINGKQQLSLSWGLFMGMLSLAEALFRATDTFSVTELQELALMIAILKELLK